MRSIKHSIPLILIIFILVIAAPVASQSQTDTLKYHIETFDGNKYIGNIIEQDQEKIIFITANLGEISIKKSDIKKKHVLEEEKMKKGKYWMDNPQSTRYFFSPNGYGLKAGEGYYQNVWVMVNSFAIGLNDYISIGGGVIPIFLFGAEATPVWFTAKASVPIKSDKFSIGGGILAGTILGEEDTGFGVLYGITTYGSKDNNVSLGLGYGFAGGEWAKSPMINLNIMLRTGAKGYFISENYFIQAGDESALIISAGGRYIIKEAGLDYGLIIPLFSEMETLIAIPWLGITIPFVNNTN
ncbi:MAG: hypothetical protein GQ527_01045 [Bacteroidales bacterium]|nr:hypothetical protein [Bacteroidales bacterium]